MSEEEFGEERFDKLMNARFYGGFAVTKDGVEIKEPEDYPAVYGGSIEYPDGSEIILDYILVENEEKYKELVKYLKEKYEENYGGDIEKRLNNVMKIIQKERKKADVPEEYRRYIKRENVAKLPKGTRVYQGPRGGLFIDVREYERITGRKFDEVEKPE